MEFKLVITAAKDNDQQNAPGREYVFKDATLVSIGRGEPNDVPLADPGRTVSRNHARIVANLDGYELEDLRSKNFTYHNGQRMETGEKRPLQNGDEITIGDFSMEFHVAHSQRELDVTLLDPQLKLPDFDTNNPFSEAIDEIFGAFGRLYALYDQADAEIRYNYFSHAVKNAAPKEDRHAVLEIFLDNFSDTEVSAPTRIPSRASVSKELPTLADQADSSDYASRVLDTALESLKGLIRIPYEFRVEFIGHTMWQDEESTFFYEGDYRATKNYLLDATSSESDLNRKLERMKKVVEKVSVHQVGMLEGYRAVVREGFGQLLLEIDPTAFENEVLNSGMLYRLFPFLGSRKILSEMKEKIAEMQQSDWSVTEQRFYRPVFIRAYMSTISTND